MGTIKYNNQQLTFYINNTHCVINTSSIYLFNPRANTSNLVYPILTTTSSINLDSNYYHIIANSSGITMSLPDASLYTEKEFLIFNASNSMITITSSVLIDNASSLTLPSSGSGRFTSYEGKWWVF